jgi:two-component system CheB/CheR fusion protein
VPRQYRTVAISSTGSDDSPSNHDQDQTPSPGFAAVGNEQPPKLPFPVVGIGASAGGLEAFLDFFRVMPADSGMAFVLIQHLPPERDSLMAEILSKHTTMQVRQVEDGIEVEPNHVYVIRPGHTLTIKDGLLRLGHPVAQPIHRRPVDDFFRTLAD